MDGQRFDRLTRTLTATLSRRVTLGGLATGVLLSFGWSLDEPLVLSKKKKGKGKKKNKKKPNCRGFRPISCGDECCSLAETCRKGKQGKQKCIGHCEDGEQNSGETDVNCGGTCRDIRKCPLLARCSEDADCETNVCDSRPDLDPGGKLCLFCRIDSDCDQLDPGNPGNFRCFRNACFECALDSDCPRPGQDAKQRFCVEPVAGGCPDNTPCACRQCRTSANCSQDQFCDETGTCIGQGEPPCEDGKTVCGGGTFCACNIEGSNKTCTCCAPCEDGKFAFQCRQGGECCCGLCEFGVCQPT
jgi:hypothetical protein